MRLTLAPIGLAVSALLLCTGCSGERETVVAPHDLLGETLAFADSVIPEGASNSVQDVGQLFDAKERFQPKQWGTSRFVVIAACADTADMRRATRVQLGVVSVDALAKSDVENARAGENQGDIGCSKGFFR